MKTILLESALEPKRSFAKDHFTEERRAELGRG